jgi:hypothetical protein
MFEEYPLRDHLRKTEGAIICGGGEVMQCPEETTEGGFHTDNLTVRQNYHNSQGLICSSVTLVFNFFQLIFLCFHSLFISNVAARSLMLSSLKVRTYFFKYTKSKINK